MSKILFLLSKGQEKENGYDHSSSRHVFSGVHTRVLIMVDLHSYVDGRPWRGFEPLSQVTLLSLLMLFFITYDN